METDRRWVVVRIDGKIASISTDYRQLATLTMRLADTNPGKGPGYVKDTTKDKAKTDRDKTKTDSGKRKTGIQTRLFNEITAVTLSLEEVWEMRKSLKWDDLMLFGTDFQKRVWRKLWELTHPETATGNREEVTKDPETAIANPEEATKNREEITKDREEAAKKQEEATEDQEEETGRSRPRLICYSDFAELCENKAGVRAVAHAVSLNPVSVIIPCHLVVPKESIDKISDIRRRMESTIFKGDDICMDSLLRDKSFDFGEYALGRELKRHLIQLELGQLR